MNLPRIVRVRQRLPGGSIADVGAMAADQATKGAALAGLKPGSRVAITAGSRGIASIQEVLRGAVQGLEAVGCQPFLVAAMGSHGGATDEGQRAVLEGYGISESAIGAPIRSSMAAEKLGTTHGGLDVYMDRNALEADATVVVGRVKAHTAFRAEVESGLCKMTCIGLGKRHGAEAAHRYGLARAVKEGADLAVERGNVAFGIAVVENAHHQVYELEVAQPRQFYEADRRLLRAANGLLPRVPFDELDVLVVGWIGKDISGSGMDLNVVGMWRRLGGEPVPNYRRLVALDLTEASRGNAFGIGLADCTTRRLTAKIDRAATMTNAVTSGSPHLAEPPAALASDRDALEVAVGDAGSSCSLVLLESTLHLDEIWVSEDLLPAVKEQLTLEILSSPSPISFTPGGDLDWAILRSMA